MTVLISILSTCFNNSKQLPEFLDKVRLHLESLGHDFEVVVVDDRSTDESWSVISSVARTDTRVRGLLLSRNFGQHPAILAGLDAVRGDVVVLMDSDMDDDPAILPQLLAPVLKGEADLVLTRMHNHRRTRFSSRLFHRLVQMSTKSPQSIGIGTYRALSATMVSALREYRDHSGVFGPLSTQIGFRHAWIDLPEDSFPRSPSRYNFRGRIRLALPLLLNEAGLPMKAVLTAAAFMATAVVSLGMIATVRFVNGGGDPFSTTSLVFLVLVINQLILSMGVAVIALYLRSILKETLHRPRYHIAEVTAPTD